MSETIQANPFFLTTDARRRAARPTAREWVRHTALFLLTACTVTIAGIMQAINPTEIPDPHLAPPARALGYVLYLPAYYVLTVAEVFKQAIAHPAYIVHGLTFACALLAILLAHEFGHYIACRRYGVDATLPFFIPTPPLFLTGTFGAFIKIKSPIPTRRALFDIGVAGPLAGFLMLVPVTIAAVLTAHPATASMLPANGDSVLIFNDPPFLRLLARALRVNLDNIAPNPFYFAAWIGLLVTSLNLLPVGQLDGGHAVFSVFGARAHKLIGRIAFVSMSLVAVLGFLWHGSPSGFVYAILLFVMLRLRHPQADDERQTLGRARTIVAAFTLLVFLLSFEFFPLTIT